MKIDSSSGTDDCHLWTGARVTKNGVARYGHIGRERGVTVLAHRAVWEEANGPIPEGMLVCHRCDNPTCCNLAHLFLGTDGDNINDMYGKGRRARLGKQCVVLADTQRDEIRAMYRSGEHTLRGLARAYGASYGCIRSIALT
jgi:hypothetical protein